MSVAKDCALALENIQGHQSTASDHSHNIKESSWIDPFSVSGSSYLRDHRVEEKIIYPAAGFSMAGIAVHQALAGAGDKQQAFTLEDLTFRHTLTISRGDSTFLGLSYDPEKSEFAVRCSHDSRSGSPTTFAVGNISRKKPLRSGAQVDLDCLLTRCSNVVDVDGFYQRLSQSGLDYGPFFRRIISARVSGHTGEAVTRLKSHPRLVALTDQWADPITLLDSAFQSLAVALDTNRDHLYMPSRIRALHIHAELEQDLWCHTRLVRSTSRAVVGDITLLNAHGQPLMEIHGLLCMKVPRRSSKYCNSSSEWRNGSTMRNICTQQKAHPILASD